MPFMQKKRNCVKIIIEIHSKIAWYIKIEIVWMEISGLCQLWASE